LIMSLENVWRKLATKLYFKIKGEKKVAVGILPEWIVVDECTKDSLLELTIKRKIESRPLFHALNVEYWYIVEGVNIK